MAVSIKITGVEELKSRLATAGKIVSTEIATEAAKEGGETLNMYAQLNVLSNFTMRSWKLHGSFKTVVTRAGNVRAGSYGISYNKIHEYGGIITPKTKNYLSFMGSDGVVKFIKRAVIPARPYLRPAYDEHRDDIEAAMGKVVYNYLKEI